MYGYICRRLAHLPCDLAMNDGNATTATAGRSGVLIFGIWGQGSYLRKRPVSIVRSTTMLRHVVLYNSCYYIGLHGCVFSIYNNQTKQVAARTLNVAT